MIQLRYHILLSFFLGTNILFAQQNTLRFWDEENEEPVIGLVVNVQSKDGKDKFSGITDGEGSVTVGGVSFPWEVETSHIGFEVYKGIINSTNELKINLQQKVTSIEEVVVEADPYRSIAINKELYEVQEIDRKAIDQLGGNNLADVLNYQMNINVTPDASTGRSTVSMFGLNGEYVKILIDNVPMAGDNSSGNNIDITQIGLENVERIEVSEGAMGVMYGPNAVAGVINIITKKGSENRVELSTSLQEETVGNEYAFFDQGRHIQNISLGSNITDQLYVNVGYRRNDLKGFLNGYKGIDHPITSDENNKERGYEWSPKLQHNLNAVVNYQLNTSFGGYYKFDYYNEELNVYSKVVNGGFDEFGRPENTAEDQLFLTNRNSHQLNVNWALKNGVSLSGLFSYQYQERENEEYTYNIDRGLKVGTKGVVKDQSSDIMFSKVMLDGLFSRSNIIGLSIGYEGEHQEGFDAIASGRYSDTIGVQTLSYNDVFVNAYLFKNSRFQVTPGFRLNTNSNYGSHLIWSLSTSYEITSDVTTRVILGSAYKTPNFTQLYYYFVDANHNVTGNPDLMPEDGISLMWVTSKTSNIGRYKLKNAIRGYHFDIKDQITTSIIEEENPDAPSDIQRTTYLNLDFFKNVGVSFENTLTSNRINAHFGVEYLGVKQTYVEEEAEAYDDECLFRFNVQSRFTYDLDKLNANITANYKYTGGGDRYFQTDGEVYKGRIDGYGLLDASVSKYFSKRAAKVQFGARNVLNVVTVNASGIPGGAHGAAGPNSVLFANGRSYFLKLAYNMNFN